MAQKAMYISELYQSTLSELSRYDNWTAFLKTVSWQYKYDFRDQVLIFAQRPDAKACASMEVWNTKMHRWINRGAKGIALFAENGSRYGLQYVFDVSDTNDRQNREVKLWSYDDSVRDAVIETLENTFGSENTKSAHAV